MTGSGLAWPPEAPATLASFPTTRRLPRRLHRVSDHTGTWWYSSRPHGGGRFDLPVPEGTCYLADDLDAALGEKLLRRPKKLVPAERLRELLHSRVTLLRPLALANLSSARATGFGVNAEIHTTLDYAKPWAWAERLRQAGTRGLRYAARSDPGLEARCVALFGKTGLHARAPAGMHTDEAPLDTRRARRLLERRGVVVVPIPRDVPTVEP
jgi:hypothetical protein